MVTPSASVAGGSMALIRSGERAVRPLAQRTCSTIGSPTFAGLGHSIRKRNGFHSAYDAVSSITAQTTSSGASIVVEAAGLRTPRWSQTGATLGSLG